MVRVHFGPPLLFLWRLTEMSSERMGFHWVFMEDLNAPWKLNIEVIMMQLWEQQLREIFYNWVINTILEILLLMSLHNSTNLRTNIGLFSVSWTKSKDIGQANKSARGMPWHQEPMKDVISCDKLRGVANVHWSGDFRMGKPTVRYRILNQIGIWGEPPELKHLSRARKRHQPRFR